MRLTKSRPKSELQLLKDHCKSEGFDYDKTTLAAEYDVLGNIIKMETDNKDIINFLKAKGFK